jgi:hypothetical protein
MERRIISVVFSEKILALCAAATHPKYSSLAWEVDDKALDSEEVRATVWAQIASDLKHLADTLGMDYGLSTDAVAVEVSELRKNLADTAKLEERFQYKYELFWKEYSKRHPDLFNLAQLYRAVPASSTSSERLLSIATFTDHRRPQLSPESLEDTILMKAWIKLFGPDLATELTKLSNAAQSLGANMCSNNNTTHPHST